MIALPRLVRRLATRCLATAVPSGSSFVSRDLFWSLRMSTPHLVPQLRRRRLGVIHLVFFTVAASAPLTVLGGGVTTTFAVSGVMGVPLSFLLMAAALALFAVGYAAMSRHVGNAGAFYSYLAQGLGPRWAVAGSFVALVAYIAIGVGLYGLFGESLADLAMRVGLDLPWWSFALLALLASGTLGVLRVDLNAGVLAVLLVAECAVVAIYDLGAIAHPVGGEISFTGLDPAALFVPGVGAVLAFTVAGFIGFESSAIYSEECRNPRVTVGRATFAALAFTGLFYGLSAWAMTVSVGTAGLQQAAAKNGPGLVFSGLAQHWGAAVADIASVLFLTSVFAAIVSFHNGVARYLFALGRERVLFSAFARVGAGSGGPVVGSAAQSVLVLVAVLLCALFQVEPVLELFTWGSGLSAVGIVVLMAGTSAAVIGFFRSRRDSANSWQRLVAPAVATVLLVAIVILLIANFDLMLAVSPSDPLRWIVPGVVLAAALAGLARAERLRGRHPRAYRMIGQIALEPDPEESAIEYGPKLRRHRHSR
ncbi:APC family permease [Amycolatopsis albidoflavus]